jgi:beta-hydroxylase
VKEKEDFPFFFHILHGVERVFAWFSVHGEREIHDPADFPWVRDLEASWRVMRGELENVLQRRDLIPNFQEISPEQLAITRDDKWKTYVLYAYGVKAPHNCRACPETAAAVERIPGMKTAFFSILSGNKHIPDHRGPYKGLLRCHLGLIVPEPADSCGLRVGRSQTGWREGKAIVFDDTFRHEAWNRSAADRVVLFIDFARPLRFPLSWLNAAVLRLIVLSPYGRRAVRRFSQWYEARGVRTDMDG